MNEIRPSRKSFWSSIGPAIITASVVLGPGSILSASQIGFEYGYELTWMLALAILLMVGMTALSARLGVVLEHTLCEELARRSHRVVAALAGVSLFLIAAGFQFGNNLGVIAGLDAFLPQGENSTAISIGIIVAMNVLVIVALIGFRSLYKHVERLMKVLVGIMLVGFAVNLVMARPSLLGLLQGLIPSIPAGAEETIIPKWEDGKIVDKFVPVVAIFSTTFSVAGAFYQSYLVKEKGWTRADLKPGLIDSTVGIGTLGLMTLMIMATSAAVLYGKPDVEKLDSVQQVAQQLEPLFGSGAVALFSLGIFAGAFSSFLVNSMIGGTMLSDGLGFGGSIDQTGPKVGTVIALLTGMIVAIYVKLTGQKPVTLIVFAQSVVVIGFPVLAAGMLWLATRSDLTGDRRVPMWLKVFATIGLVVVTGLALRMGVRLWLEYQH